jgi:MaoC like domain/N-terminal half of MaoC dehydratase
MSLEALEGRTYGPVNTRITAERVSDFVAATGDDPERWRAAAPPGYAATLLFAVAPLLIGDSDVGDNTRVLVHTDQRFTWHHPLAVELPVVIEGSVSRVRSRGPLSFVGLDVEMTTEGEPLVSSSSTFLMGAEPAAEPGPDRGEPGVTAGSLPGEGGAAAVRGASRLDLVRYAAASGDFNPIHFDHDSARAAGLDGIVVHGLLMAAWLAQAASMTEGRRRTDPLAELKLRFRASLAPAEQAEVVCDVGPTDGDVAKIVLALRRNGTDLVTGTATARPAVAA